MRAEDFAITHGRVIELNENAYRDVSLLQNEYQKSVNKGWFVQGTDYRAIIHHEFGHTLADVYKIDPLKIAEVFADMTTDNPDEFSLKFYNKVLEIVGGKGNER